MNALQLFEPHPHTVYSIEATARLAGVPRHSILVYCRHRLVTPIDEPERGYFFNDATIRALRRIEEWRARGLNIAGLKLALELTGELERLQAELRGLRR